MGAPGDYVCPRPAGGVIPRHHPFFRSSATESFLICPLTGGAARAYSRGSNGNGSRSHLLGAYHHELSEKLSRPFSRCLPLGDMYHAIQLTYGGTVFDQGDMTGIRLIIDGKTVWNITGTHLDLLNNYRKLTDASATKLTMWFADPTLNDQGHKQIRTS